MGKASVSLSHPELGLPFVIFQFAANVRIYLEGPVGADVPTVGP